MMFSPPVLALVNPESHAAAKGSDEFSHPSQARAWPQAAIVARRIATSAHEHLYSRRNEMRHARSPLRVNPGYRHRNHPTAA
jgi:hypothetical protein